MLLIIHTISKYLHWAWRPVQSRSTAPPAVCPQRCKANPKASAAVSQSVAHYPVHLTDGAFTVGPQRKQRGLRNDVGSMLCGVFRVLAGGGIYGQDTGGFQPVDLPHVAGRGCGPARQPFDDPH